MADVCELELCGDSPVESPTVADGAKAVAKVCSLPPYRARL